MKTKLPTKKIFLLILSIFILSCSLFDPTTVPSQATDAGEATAPPLEDTSAATLPPTVPPTATVYPPVYDPNAIGDNRELDSFILSFADKTTGAGETHETYYKAGYIREPFSGFQDYLNSLSQATRRNYWIDGWSYRTTGSEDYIIGQGYDQQALDYFLERYADMRWVNDINLGALSAEFTGQEDIAGIPANHFTFDETDLGEQGSTYTIEKAEGDIYLAQGANYLLRFHIKLTGNVYSIPGEAGYSSGVREYTEELSSINQLTEIALPAEYLKEEQTLFDLNIPLPADATMYFMRRFKGSNIDNYYFSSSLSDPEFFEFYKNLAPTDGWTVSYVGKIGNHYSCNLQDCVMMKNGAKQIVIANEVGAIVVDYDRAHMYSP